MNRQRSCELLRCALALATALLAQTPAAHAQHAGHRHGAAGNPELGTSAAIDRDGRIWAAYKESESSKESAKESEKASEKNTGKNTKNPPDGAAPAQFVALRMSADGGKSWSAPRRVLAAPEPVAAGGESRPKIAFGGKGELYIAYTMPVARPHVGEIRFVRSLDGGQTFSAPVTVNLNRDAVTHSFESLIVDRAGRIYLAWIDGRDAGVAKARGERYAGSALYYAVSHDGGATFRGDYKVADHTCECCRIGLAINPQGNPVAFWRHVFAPNIRDHALAELTPDGIVAPPERATFDDWRVDACPHHGPSVAYGPGGVRHQVWFNGSEGDGGGVLYASTAPGAAQGKPMNLGSAQASHADVAVRKNHVAVVWKQFEADASKSGGSSVILGRLSDDGGASWRQLELARTASDSDNPFLVSSEAQTLLVWRTANEGFRTVILSKDKS